MPSAGLHCTNGGAAHVEDCRFESNQGWGIYLSGGDAEIRKCRIRDIKRLGRAAGYGIVVIEGSPVIDGCEIEKVATGIGVGSKGDATIRACKIDKGTETGLLVIGNARASGKTEISNFDMGVFVLPKGNATLDDCRIHDNVKHGVLVGGTAKIENCSVYGQKGRGNDPLTGRGIEVASKTGNAVISQTTVYGNKRIGIAVFGIARLESRCDVYKNEAEGVYVHRTGNLTASDSKIHDSTTYGLVCFGKYAISKCEIARNTKGGAYLQNDSNGSLRDVNVEFNKGHGVEMNGTGKFENCQFSRNDGDGLHVGAGNADVISCRIQSNKSYGVYVGWQTIKNLSTFGTATITGGDMTNNVKKSLSAVDGRATINTKGTVKTDMGTGKP